MKKIPVLIVCLCSIFFTGCAQKSDHVVTIRTRFGDMVAILYDQTPKHKKNFIKLASEGYYDSLLFHRVMQGFMIQGGDPQSRKAKKGDRLGNGGPGYTLEAEVRPELFHEKGALCAARLGDQQNPSKASSGSQFYIVHGRTFSESELLTDPAKFNAGFDQFFKKPENKKYFDSLMVYYRNRDQEGSKRYLTSLKPVVEQQLGIKVDKDMRADVLKAYTTVGGAPHLDGNYTVFGKIIKGLEVVDKIAALQVDPAKRPVDDVTMAITVEELPKKKIEKLYGYQYPE